MNADQKELPIPKAAVVQRRCAHGTFPFPCPWPSCLNGNGGKRRLRLLVERQDGSRVALWFRRRMRTLDNKVVFDWTPDEPAPDATAK